MMNFSKLTALVITTSFASVANASDTDHDSYRSNKDRQTTAHHSNGQAAEIQTAGLYQLFRGLGNSYRSGYRNYGQGNFGYSNYGSSQNGYRSTSYAPTYRNGPFNRGYQNSGFRGNYGTGYDGYQQTGYGQRGCYYGR